MARSHTPPRAARGGRLQVDMALVDPRFVTTPWLRVAMVAKRFCGSKMPAGLLPGAQITAEPVPDGAHRRTTPGGPRWRHVARRGDRAAASQNRPREDLLRSASRPGPLPHPDKRPRYLLGQLLPLPVSPPLPPTVHMARSRSPPRAARGGKPQVGVALVDPQLATTPWVRVAMVAKRFCGAETGARATAATNPATPSGTGAEPARGAVRTTSSANAEPADPA